MKNGNSDTAARIISKACEDKYGLPAYKKIEKEDALRTPEAEAPAAEAASAESAIKNGTSDKVIGLESDLYPERHGKIKPCDEMFKYKSNKGERLISMEDGNGNLICGETNDE